MNNFSDTSTLSPQELEILDQDEEKFFKYVQELPEWKEIMATKEQLIEEMEQIALTSKSLKPVIQDKKHKLLNKLDELDVARKVFEKCSISYDEKVCSLSPRALEDRLQVAALEAEEEAEKLAESFLNGELQTDQFILQFMEKRTLGHLRRVKEEKLHKQLSQLLN